MKFARLSRRVRRSFVRHCRRKNPQAKWLLARSLHRYADRFFRLRLCEAAD